MKKALDGEVMTEERKRHLERKLKAGLPKIHKAYELARKRRTKLAWENFRAAELLARVWRLPVAL